MDKIRKILCSYVPENKFDWYGGRMAGRRLPGTGKTRKKDGLFPGKCLCTPVLCPGMFDGEWEKTI